MYQVRRGLYPPCFNRLASLKSGTIMALYHQPSHLPGCRRGKIMPVQLKLLPARAYKGINQYDPIKYYYWPVFGRMYRRRVELALEECSGGERVLEVGFGTGLAFPNLHDLYREIHGIDLTADIHAVRSVFEPMGIPLFLEKGDVLKMPYADGFFDTVLMVSILEHLKPSELIQAFAEVRRVLKPGGQM
ncbi:MAG: class I SAM-dependent methyltransferase, partial [Chloroflexi bacterium]|nr:class I SAM-dependent methyltransferase [Chloroflexota bacterium]